MSINLIGKRIVVKDTGGMPVIKRYIPSTGLYYVSYEDGSIGWLNRSQFDLT